MKLIAIDPGDVHCGVAYFETTTEVRDGRDRIIRQDGWECTDTQEHLPGDLEDGLALALIDGDFDVIVLEQFNLYPDKAMAQTGSTMPTCEVIGVVKWLVRAHNHHAVAHMEAQDQGRMLTCEVTGGTCADPGKVVEAVRLVLQPASIQTPTKAILRRRGIKSTAKRQRTGDHTFSAELHGWHWILNGQKG